MPITEQEELELLELEKEKALSKSPEFEGFGGGRSGGKGASASLSIPSLIGRNLKQAAIDTVGAAQSGINTALLGVPEIAFQKFLNQNFVRQDASQDAVSMGSMMGLALGAPKAIGSGLTNVASKIPFGGIPGGALKGAIVGAGLRGTQLPSPEEAPTIETAVEEMKRRTLEGATGGAILGAAGGVVGKVINGFKSMKVSKLAKQAAKELPKVEGKIKDVRMSGQIKADEIRLASTQAKEALVENQKILTSKLQKTITEKSPNIMGQTKGYFKAFNETYGDGLDTVAKQFGNTTKQEAGSFIKGVLQDASKNPDLVKTSSFKELTKLHKSIMKGKGDIPFAKFHSSVKSFLKGRTYDGGSDVENVVFDEFRHRYGDFVAGKSSAFKPLQEHAAKVLEFKKGVSRLFGKGSEYNTKNLESLLKKFSLGKDVTAGEQKILQELQEGVGVYLKDIQQAGQQVQTGAKQLSGLTGATKTRMLKESIKIKKQLQELYQTAAKNKELIAAGKKPEGGLAKRFGGYILRRAVDIATFGVITKMMKGLGE